MTRDLADEFYDEIHDSTRSEQHQERRYLYGGVEPLSWAEEEAAWEDEEGGDA